MAAVLVGGPRTALSHRSAGELWGLLEPIEGPVHVTVPHGRKQTVGVVFHRSGSDVARAKCHSIEVTTVSRTLLDLASVATRGELRRAVDEAERRDQLDRGALGQLCERSGGRRGVGALRALLDERSLPLVETRSHLERRFLRYCRDRRLPIPAVNAPLAGFEVDCLWPEERVVVELDGWAHHATRDAFESDRKRDARIQLAGHRIVRVTHRRITYEGDELEAEIRSLLAGA
jgi:very-short-patch-repair endonuclease